MNTSYYLEQIENEFDGKLQKGARYILAKAIEMKTSFALKPLYDYYCEYVGNDYVSEGEFKELIKYMPQFVELKNDRMYRTDNFNREVTRMSEEERTETKKEVLPNKTDAKSGKSEERFNAAMKEIEKLVEIYKPLIHNPEYREEFDKKYNTLTLIELPERYNLDRCITTERYLQWKNSSKK